MPGYFLGQDVFILGSGASLCGFDLNRLNGKNVIACAHMINFFPAQFCVFLDVSVIAGLNKKPGPDAGYHAIVSEATGLSGSQYVTTISTRIKHKQRLGVQLDSKGPIYSAFSSGYAATNLALIMQAKRIFLLGHDCGPVNGKTHCYDLLKTKKAIPDQARGGKYIEFKHGWQAFARFDCIYNLTPESKIELFPRMNIDDVV